LTDFPGIAKVYYKPVVDLLAGGYTI